MRQHISRERPPADAHAAEQLGLVAHADLPKLDPGLEDARQILHEIAEIDPAVRREIKEHLAVVKCVLRLDQLHVELPLGDLALADPVGLPLLPVVLRCPLPVVRRRHPEDRLQRLRDPLIRKLHRSDDHLAVLDAAGGLDDHPVIVVDLKGHGIKIINFTNILKLNANNSRHT